MKHILVLITFLLLGSSLYAQSTEAEILRLVNKHRARKGLPELQQSNLIANSAEKHSRNMAKGKVRFGHGGFDERIDYLLKNIKGANAAAENVAYGPTSAEAVVDMWLKSPGHKKNIEGKFNLTGIAIAESRDGTPYYTQIFINQK